MTIAIHVHCSINEARRALGLPDVLPLYELGSRLLERWMVQRLQAADALAAGSRATRRKGPRREPGV